jgi:hypothetical protein
MAIGFPDWFMPSVYEYDRGHLDVKLQTCYGIPYPIKGVMYCTLKNRDDNILLRDANGDYYYWQETVDYSKTNRGEVDEYLGRFRHRSNMSPEEFVKSFKSVISGSERGVPGEDIEELQLIPGHKIACRRLMRQQEELAELHYRFRAYRGCSCTIPWVKPM